MVSVVFFVEIALVPSLIGLELEKAFQVLLLGLDCSLCLIEDYPRLCGAREMGLPRESLAVTLFPDTDKWYTIPDVVVYRPLDTKVTVSHMRISAPSVSLTNGCLCT